MRNNIKISFEKPSYVVDEKNGVVICKLAFKVDAPSCVTFASKGRINNNPCHFVQTSKGVAFAKNSDTFDINIGKRVSLAKAENLAYSWVNNWAKSAQNELVNAISTIIDFSNKTRKVREHNVEYIKKF